VIPSFNHESYVEEALQSVFDQSYPQLELVVIDDGSVDRSPEIIRAALRRSPYPHRFVARENRGAAPTINEGIRMAAGSYVNILNSDDRFHPERMAKMVREVAAPGAEWGFAACSFIDGSGQPSDLLRDAKAYSFSCAISAIPYKDTVGFALLAQNVAISTGNLFFNRELWANLQGFRDLRYNHDWDFCLRALWEAEPVYVSEPLYTYRIHRGNTIGESRDRPRTEADSFVNEYLRRAFAEEDAAPNAYAPCVRHWGMRFVQAVLNSGIGQLVDSALLQQLAVTLGPERAPSSIVNA
jgi:glycosyltransferase involved in cell wall biosynthesis